MIDSPQDFLAALCFLLPPRVLKSEHISSDSIFEKIGRPILMKSLTVSPLLASTVGNVSTKANLFSAQQLSKFIAAEFAFDFLLNADEGRFSMAG